MTEYLKPIIMQHDRSLKELYPSKNFIWNIISSSTNLGEF